MRNSVCVAGIDRDSVLAVKKQVYRLLSGRCALESFHFRNGDDVKDGALFVPKVILVAVFQPGRKLIDDNGDEGQLDEAYDEIFENGGRVERQTQGRHSAFAKGGKPSQNLKRWLFCF